MKTSTSLLCIFLLITGSGITACSSTPPASPASGSGINPSAVFSNTKELSYVPPQTEYRIGVSDLIDVQVFQAKELSQTVQVNSRGYISLPLIDEVKAVGLTQAELQQQIAAKLGEKYLQNPQVTLFIKEATAQRFTVEGEVTRPSIYPMKGSTTVLQAIAQAGGTTNLASPSKIVLLRQQDGKVRAFNLSLNTLRNGADPYLENDDRIIVNRSDSRYWIKEAASFIGPINILNTLIN